MCRHVKFADGNMAIICGLRGKMHFCACGREADFLCDWKAKARKSGTCDRPICAKCAHQVGPDKHLCPEHERAWQDWQKRHPGFIPRPDYTQMAFVLEAAEKVTRAEKRRKAAKKKGDVTKCYFVT